jgi:hypothetical protein
MSAERTGARLLRAYPPAWRRRYGGELENLIVEASEGGRVGWRTRLDVLLGGGRERFRAAGGGSPRGPGERVRASLAQVLCAWGVFVVAGLIVQRLSEHWQAATPPAVDSLPRVAFGVLVGAAACGTVLVLAGAAAALPALLAFLRDGGWSRIRRRVAVAALLSVLALAATAALAAWATSLDSHQREGGDAAYSVAFLAWALLVCGCLTAWTAAAVGVAARLELPPTVLRLQGWLAAGVAVTMATMTAALIVWWVALASSSHSFLARRRCRRRRLDPASPARGGGGADVERDLACRSRLPPRSAQHRWSCLGTVGSRRG